MPSPDARAARAARRARRTCATPATCSRWDQQVMMPPAGGAARGAGARRRSQSLAHERLVAPELGALLDAENGDDPQLVARRAPRPRASRASVPGELAAEMARAGSRGLRGLARGARGQRLRASSSPRCGATSSCARALRRLLPGGRAPLRRAAGSLRARHDDRAGPRRSSRTLRDGLVPLLAEIAAAARAARRCTARSRSPRSARSASRSSRAMGFDESAWRLDDAVHPFAASPSRARRARHLALRRRRASPASSRSCTRSATASTSTASTRRSRARRSTPASRSASTSRRAGCGRTSSGAASRSGRHWLPRAARALPATLRGVDARGLPARDQRRARRRSSASRPTRLTYSLHVILRFELELALIEGTLDAADLPAAWADEDARDARHRGARRPARRPAGHPLVRGDHRLLPDLRDRQRARRAALARRARRPARPRRRRSRAASTATCAPGSSRRSTATAAA